MKSFFTGLRGRLRHLIPHPKIRDETVQELGLLAFFCMFGVGLWWVNPALSMIICGLMGTWFFFPRGR